MNLNEEFSYNLIDNMIDNGMSTYFKDESQNTIDSILDTYSKRESYIRDLLSGFTRKDTGIENGILDLFNNVRALILNKDVSLIRNSIYSISTGRENALRFLNEEKENLDDETIRIMNVIVNEYSTYLNYLNKALNVLE